MVMELYESFYNKDNLRYEMFATSDVINNSSPDSAYTSTQSSGISKTISEE
jgi:hypothetical protein